MTKTSPIQVKLNSQHLFLSYVKTISKTFIHHWRVFGAFYVFKLF